MYSITLIPGDGIGPEIMEAAVQVLEATGVSFKWEKCLAGMAAVEAGLPPLPEATLASISKTRVAFKGPLTTPVGEGYRSVNVTLRRHFRLYANVRPAKSFEGPQTPFQNVDLVIIRENTEGLYSGIEHTIEVEGQVVAAESVAIITRAGSENIIRYAFEHARKNGRKRVTLVHKANILKLTTGMFLTIGRDLAREYPEVEFNECIIDACAMRLVMNPQQFDVIVTTNLFGDILSDLTAGLVGGLGITSGANIGRDGAVFEAVHGSAPDIAGKHIANPAALIMAGVQMLEYLGENEAAQRVERAVRAVIKEGVCVTPDLRADSKCSTMQMAQAIIDRLERG